VRELVASELAEAVARNEGRPNPSSFLSFGLPSLDRVFSGAEPSEVTVLAGLPAHGKSALALQVSRSWAALGRGSVYLFSHEMSRQGIARRACRQALKLDRDPTAGELMAFEEQAFENLHVDSDATDVEGFCRRVEVFAMSSPLTAVVMDYLQLACKARGRQSRTEAVCEGSIRVKQLAMDLNVPVLELAQFTKPPKELRKPPPPSINDLCDSSQIEKDAAHVLSVHQPGKFDSQVDPRLMLVSVLKNRNGVSGEVLRMTFEGPKFTVLDGFSPALRTGEDQPWRHRCEDVAMEMLDNELF
jgi:replicative DNA helicase